MRGDSDDKCMPHHDDGIQSDERRISVIIGITVDVRVPARPSSR
jgi:hypothetical protein